MKVKMSLNTKLFLTFAVLITSIAILILLFNLIFLEGFYLRKKEKNIVNFYKGIDELYTSGEASLAMLSSQFEKLETNRSISFVIKNQDGSVIYVTSKDYSKDYNNSKKVSWTNSPTLNSERIENVLNENRKYIVRRYHDRFLNSEFLTLIGRLNDGSFIYLRSPLEFVKESINISNSFLLIILGILLVLSSVLSFFLSRNFTKPIRDLNDMTKKMSNLDFSEKYKVTTNDEIGMLGRSINSLSESLETKIQG